MKSTPEKILEAAAVEFAEHGFAGVRMVHVARRAGVNKALVYRHFDDKEGLYRATLEREIVSRQKFIGELPDSLAEMLILWTRRQRQDVDFVRLIAREGLVDDGEEPIDAEGRTEYYREQIARLKKLQDIGEIDETLDPECLFFALLTITVGPVILPQLMRLAIGGDNREERWEDFLEQLASRL